MPVICSASGEIAAPPRVVWGVLTDLGRYAEWNPATPTVVSTLVPGHRVRIHARLRGVPVVVFDRVLAVVPERELTWGIHVPGLLRGERRQLLTPTPVGTRYETVETFTGLLAPAVRRAAGAAVSESFAALVRALKERAEAVHAGRVA